MRDVEILEDGRTGTVVGFFRGDPELALIVLESGGTIDGAGLAAGAGAWLSG